MSQESDHNTDVERVDLQSLDVAEQKRLELLRLFPEVRTEGGKIDLDRLKLTLGAAVDIGKERYGLTWPGKAECFRTIQTPSTATLRPLREESVNFDTTENLIIEGDNLEVLKLLQKSYLGKVKMIYIDPPYNTGNDFIYPDNYAESIQTYLEYTGQVDAEGRQFSTNTDTDGRFHSKWLNMMYPRLFVARNLLTEDGTIFISIDHHELHNLRRLCDEVFGEENLVGIICWKNVTDNNPTLITPDNEFIVCYARSKATLPQSWRSTISTAKELLQSEYERLKKLALGNAEIEERLREFIADNEESVGFLTRYKFVDDHGVYTGSESVHNPRPGGYDFEITHPVTGGGMRKPANGYRFPETTYRAMEANGEILFGPDENRIVKIKKYLEDYEDSLRSVIVMDGRLGSYELKRLFPDQETLFTNPKPTELLESLVSFATDEQAIIMDFFAGSGSLGHAVCRLNRRKESKRRYILVQLPQKLDESNKTEKNAAQFLRSLGRPAVLSQLTRERMRRASKAESATPLLDGSLLGFRALSLAESNLLAWNSDTSAQTKEVEEQLSLHVRHLRPERTDDDLLFEIILKEGFPPSTRSEALTVGAQKAQSLAEGALIVCLSRKLDLEAIRAIVDQGPQRVVCLDDGFAGNDQLKANAAQIFKAKGIVFRTV